MMQRVAAQFREGVAAPESAAAPGPVQRGRAPTVRRGVPTAFHAVLFWLRFTYVTPCACHESEEMDTPGHTGPLHPGRPLGALPAPTGARCPIVNPPITAYLSWQQQQQGLSHRGGAPPRPKSSRLCLAAAPQVWTEMATSRHRAPPPPPDSQSQAAQPDSSQSPLPTMAPAVSPPDDAQLAGAAPPMDRQHRLWGAVHPATLCVCLLDGSFVPLGAAVWIFHRVHILSSFIIILCCCCCCCCCYRRAALRARHSVPTPAHRLR
jgi:hypothetical protein